MEEEINGRMIGQGNMEKEILNKRVGVADIYISILIFRFSSAFYYSE